VSDLSNCPVPNNHQSPKQMKNLHGKNIIITGAGSGIGRALAQRLAAEGATLILNDYKADALEETISKINGEVETHIFDVADLNAWQTFADAVIGQHGHVEVVINNAGVALGEISVMETTMEQMEWLMGINFWGVVYGTKSFLPTMLELPEASVVNISSVFGLAGIGGQSTYCSAKFAVRGFTESLRMEMLNTNVCVTTVHPGGIQTNIVRDSVDPNEERKERLIKSFDEAAITSADEAARTIIEGIKKKKERVLIGRDARALDRLVRWFPAKYSRTLFKQFERKRT